ncbi:LysR family transcriptional regulator [Acetobacter ghanensis]|uniref:LysR family transcriptional regulator n=1 Tax=Acetobacter ghanensis TaxID=431306 RepID=A0A0U5F791_9PROT|nr:LysR family transcriptional regulator [Acetobacter ghanensis]NHO40523.1 LysR family transcriptional regulator [Acetobacter ghanensis]GBQ52330.1 transcriptional regulator [Acetobacter ghanensis DSM 18895]CEF57416.1 LysR family transcriptional regulator [Acetobacter ghanensis]
MLLGRAAIYFDEVVRRGSLRRAADVLHIAPSAVDRQIIQLEEELGAKLFERTPSGMRMTAASEILIDGVRRWRRDLQRIRSEIDNLVGLRRGKVAIGIVEGATEFVSAVIVEFRKRYPAIEFRMQVYGAQGVIDQVLSGDIDVGVTFNPPNNPTIRLERTMIYRLGLVVCPEHPLADRTEISFSECASYPMIIPDESISLRRVLDNAWARHVGGTLRAVAEVSSIGLMKTLSMQSVGAGWMTAFDAMNEIEAGTLIFIPLQKDDKIELSTLSVVSASGRNLSVPALLMLQHLGQAMENHGVPII